MELHLYAAGSNARGQLGSGDCEDQHTFKPVIFAREVDGKEQASPKFPPNASNIRNIACGSNHTLLLFNSHELWVSGESSRGQLASAPSTAFFRKLSIDRTRCNIDESLLPLNVAATWETSYVVFGEKEESNTLSDTVISFGADDFGDRGVGSSPPAEPSVVDFRQALSGNPWRIKVRELVAGQHHVLASLEVWEAEEAKSYMVVVGWGASRHGQLGASPAGTKKPNKKSARVMSQVGAKVDKPVIIATYLEEERPIQLAAGAQHSLILHSTHRVTALGSSREGQLNFPESLLKPNTNPYALRTIGCTWSTSFFLTYRKPHKPDESHHGLASSWRMDSCGRSNHGQLGRPLSEDTPFGIILDALDRVNFWALACGSEHVLVVTNRGVYGWGWNEHGNLGLGHTEDVPKPKMIYSTNDVQVISPDPREQLNITIGAWAGCGTSWVLVQETPGLSSHRCEGPP
ncbi:RCC1/BLIP-II protein [Ceratobasidium sp. AG-Ba]|nr:RCC1/BLIP-II protein [Ceratobasidium sp. AG-Ba]QRW09198.1 RCC1/BLIP-II protein [Ceratobasidium sp. AG-Ba]